MLESIINNYNKGSSIRELSRKYVLNRRQITNLLKTNNIQIRPAKIYHIKNEAFDVIKFINNNVDIVNVIKDMYLNKMISYKDISKKLNISKFRIRRILLHFNIFRSSKETLQLKHKKGFLNINKVPLYKFEGNFYQGSYELKYALWLKQNNIDFTTHGNIRQFRYLDVNGKEHLYFPDFYLTKTDEYIEIKGLHYDKSVKKMNLVKKYNSNIKFTILTRRDLIKIKAFSIAKRKDLNKLYKVSEQRIPQGNKHAC